MQKETAEEREDAISRGKATASVIGVRGMGTRFNTLMTIQIPLKKNEPEYRSLSSYGLDCLVDVSSISNIESISETLAYEANCFSSSSNVKKKTSTRKGFGVNTKKFWGKSSAARVSRGSQVENDNWTGLTVKEPKRHENECITCTIVMYYTCEGGVPSEEDVMSAIEDLENLYTSVENNGHLADDKFNYMKDELTVANIAEISNKIKTQPPPKPNGVSFWNIFPSFTTRSGGEK
jgi:huntingtin